MSNFAQFRHQYDGSGRAQFIGQYLENAVGLQLVVEIDGGNASATLSEITDAASESPTVWIDARPAAITGTNGSGWRHMFFAVEQAEGKTPVFRINRDTMDRGSSIPTNWLPLLTQDFVTWTQAPSRTLVGGSSGYIEFQFSDPLPAGRVYIATQPLGQQSHAEEFATELLTDYSSVAAPTGSADEFGVISVTPVEVDENDRPIGEHKIHGIKLDWGGSTTDGNPKRKLVCFAGVHSAGEHTSWLAFVASVRWMLDDVSGAADDFRSNWDVYLYFNLTPNGLMGGHRRHNFRVSTDPNRDFINKSLAEISAVTTAGLADTSGSAHALFSWHGHATQTNAFIPGTPSSPNTETAAFISIGETVFGEPAVDYFQDIASADFSWGYNALGCKVAFACEVPQRSTTLPSHYHAIGENWAKTLQAADAAGLFTAVNGDIATTLTGITAALSASHGVVGDMATTLTGATAALTSTHGVAGNLTTTLDDTTAALTGSLGVAGDIATTLDGATFALSGDYGVAGDLGVTLDDVAAALVGSFGADVEGDLATTLTGATASFAGVHGAVGDLATTLDDATASFAGNFGTDVEGDIATTLAGVTAVITASHGVTGDFSATFAGVTAALEGSTVGVTEGDLAATLTGVTASFAGTHIAPAAGDLATTLEGATAAFVGETSQPPVGDFSVTLEDVGVSLQGIYGVTGDLQASLDGALAAFAGTHITAPTGVLDTTLEGVTPDIQSTHGVRGDLAAVLDGATLLLSDKQPSIGFAPFPGAISITSRTGYISISDRPGVQLVPRRNGVTVFRG